MLRLLRNKRAAKKIWITLAIVIIPAFCLWGFGSALRSKKKAVFLGRVFGKSINFQEYLRNYKAVRNQFLIQLGQEQLVKLEKYLNLENHTWERIILLAEAKRRKIRVSNKEVVDVITKQYPFFQKEGHFDSALYQETITYVFGINPRVFEEEVRDNLTIAKLYEEITSGITLKDEEIKNAYIKENEQISLDYISALIDDFLNQVSIEDSELLDYYNKNREQFRKPLSYNLEYIKIDTADKQIVNSIVKLLDEGYNLQEVAKNTDLEVNQTGLFSNNEPIPGIGWSTEILRILPKLESETKAWPQPIQTDAKTFYFIKLKEKKQPHIPRFDDIKDKVDQRFRQQKARQIAQERLNACRNEAEASGFTEAAEKFNLKTGKTELFKRRGYVKGLGDSDIFFEAVQNLAENEISQIVNTPAGFYIVKLKERIQPDEEEFKQKKQEFANQLLEENKQTYFKQFLAELNNRPDTFLQSTAPDSP